MDARLDQNLEKDQGVQWWPLYAREDLVWANERLHQKCASKRGRRAAPQAPIDAWKGVWVAYNS